MLYELNQAEVAGCRAAISDARRRAAEDWPGGASTVDVRRDARILGATLGLGGRALSLLTAEEILAKAQSAGLEKEFENVLRRLRITEATARPISIPSDEYNQRINRFLTERYGVNRSKIARYCNLLHRSRRGVQPVNADVQQPVNADVQQPVNAAVSQIDDDEEALRMVREQLLRALEGESLREVLARARAVLRVA